MLEVIDRRLIGIEKQMNRIANQMTKQQYPDLGEKLCKKVEECKNSGKNLTLMPDN